MRSGGLTNLLHQRIFAVQHTGVVHGHGHVHPLTNICTKKGQSEWCLGGGQGY